MANTFGILAALVLALSAFVAFKNKGELQTQIEVTEVEEARKLTQKNNFDDLVVATEDMVGEMEAASASRDDFQAQLKEQQASNKEIETEISTKDAELKETQDRVAAAKDALDELGDLKDLAPKIEALKSDIAQLEDEVAILRAQTSRLSGEDTAVSNRSSALSKILSDRNSGRSLPSLNTSVANVSGTLGFVTLAAGDNSGVVTGSKLDVKSGDETIAQLTVTAVSANTATADIIASSVKEGATVSPGDRVVASQEASK